MSIRYHDINSTLQEQKQWESIAQMILNEPKQHIFSPNIKASRIRLKKRSQFDIFEFPGFQRKRDKSKTYFLKNGKNEFFGTNNYYSRMSCHCKDCGQISNKQQSLRIKQGKTTIAMHQKERLAALIIQNLKKQDFYLSTNQMGKSKLQLKRFINSHKQVMIQYTNNFGGKLRRQSVQIGQTQTEEIQLSEQLNKILKYQALLEDDQLQNQQGPFNTSKKNIFRRQLSFNGKILVQKQSIIDNNYLLQDLSPMKLQESPTQEKSQIEEMAEVKFYQKHDNSTSRLSNEKTIHSAKKIVEMSVEDKLQHLLPARNKNKVLNTFLSNHTSQPQSPTNLEIFTKNKIKSIRRLKEKSDKSDKLEKSEKMSKSDKMSISAYSQAVQDLQHEILLKKKQNKANFKFKSSFHFASQKTIYSHYKSKLPIIFQKSSIQI